MISVDENLPFFFFFSFFFFFFLIGVFFFFFFFFLLLLQLDKMFYIQIHWQFYAMPNVALFDIFIFLFDLLHCYCILFYLYPNSIHCYCTFLYLYSISVHFYCMFYVSVLYSIIKIYICIRSLFITIL